MNDACKEQICLGIATVRNFPLTTNIDFEFACNRQLKYSHILLVETGREYLQSSYERRISENNSGIYS